MTLFPVSLSHFIAGASFKLSASGPLRYDLGTVASRQRVYLFIEQLCRFAHGTAKSTEIILKQVNRKPLLEAIIYSEFTVSAVLYLRSSHFTSF